MPLCYSLIRTVQNCLAPIGHGFGDNSEMIAAAPKVDVEIGAYFHFIGKVEVTTGSPYAFAKETKTGALKPLSLGKTYQLFGTNAHV